MDETDALAETFACAGQVGTGGSGDEQPMYTMVLALGSAMNAPGGCDDGFLRDDALLVVVVIADEEDDHEVDACNQLPQSGSPGEPADWYNLLVAAKGGVETNVVLLARVGPPAPNLCPPLGRDRRRGGGRADRPARGDVHPRQRRAGVRAVVRRLLQRRDRGDRERLRELPAAGVSVAAPEPARARRRRLRLAPAPRLRASPVGRVVVSPPPSARRNT